MEERMHVQGTGAFLVDRALARLVADPEQLDRERRRFSQSPPAYASPSGTATEFPSPNHEARQRSERESGLCMARVASEPSGQFPAQAPVERGRLLAGSSSRTSKIPPGVGSDTLADDIVKTDPEASGPSGPRSRRRNNISEAEPDGASTAPAALPPRRSKRTCRQAKDRPEALRPRTDKSPAPKRRQPRAAGSGNAPPEASAKSRGVAKGRSPRKKRTA
ncbi:hypothetical protein E4U53_002996 [Claviceps sorghi]|nr:hypothetical protein E4U53_002996 [Claviceps sorghi]